LQSGVIGKMLHDASGIGTGARSKNGDTFHTPKFDNVTTTQYRNDVWLTQKVQLVSQFTNVVPKKIKLPERDTN
jgi:hypothetical protein